MVQVSYFSMVAWRLPWQVTEWCWWHPEGGSRSHSLLCASGMAIGGSGPEYTVFVQAVFAFVGGHTESKKALFNVHNSFSSTPDKPTQLNKLLLTGYSTQ